MPLLSIIAKNYYQINMQLQLTIQVHVYHEIIITLLHRKINNNISAEYLIKQKYSKPSIAIAQ